MTNWNDSKLHRQYTAPLITSRELFNMYEDAQASLAKLDSRLSIAKELELQVAELKRQLEVKERLQKLLTDNPVIEEFMNLSRGILR